MNNTEEIRAKFEFSYLTECEDNYNMSDFHDDEYADQTENNHWKGYQQAVKDMEAVWINLNSELPAIGHPVIIKYKGALQNETWNLDASGGDLSDDVYWLEPYVGGEGEHCISSENFKYVEWVSLSEVFDHE